MVVEEGGHDRTKRCETEDSLGDLVRQRRIARDEGVSVMDVD